MLNKLLINKLISDKSAWSYIDLDEYYNLQGIGSEFVDNTMVQQFADEEFPSKLAKRHRQGYPRFVRGDNGALPFASKPVGKAGRKL